MTLSEAAAQPSERSDLMCCYKLIEDRSMDVKIKINTDGFPMPEHATVDEVLAARISEQEHILNALEFEKSKALEKKSMLESIVREAARPRSAGL